MGGFKALGVKEEYVKSLTELGINDPSGIQQEAIPVLLNGRGDFIGQAQTGTGKTIAFCLPILHQIDPSKKEIQALILCPTRELGQQIAKQCFKLTKYSDRIFTEAVYGGEKIENQIDRLSRPTQILVATPGRLVDLIRRKVVKLDNVSTVVLDEADEMLSLGFKEDISFVLGKTSGTANTWLFSATFQKGLKQIISNYLSSDAKRIDVSSGLKTNPSILHQYAVCDPGQKFQALMYFLNANKGSRGMIFCRTKKATKELHQQLIEKKFKVDCIHGDLQQKEREKVMRAFRNEKIDALIATDITARGIDVTNLAYVFHYELPDQLDYYTHRSGRTGRGGQKGISVALVVPKEVKYLKEMGKKLDVNFKKLQ